MNTETKLQQNFRCNFEISPTTLLWVLIQEEIKYLLTSNTDVLREHLKYKLIMFQERIEDQALRNARLKDM